MAQCRFPHSRSRHSSRRSTSTPATTTSASRRLIVVVAAVLVVRLRRTVATLRLAATHSSRTQGKVILRTRTHAAHPTPPATAPSAIGRHRMAKATTVILLFLSRNTRRHTVARRRGPNSRATTRVNNTNKAIHSSRDTATSKTNTTSAASPTIAPNINRTVRKRVAVVRHRRQCSRPIPRQ